MPGLSELWSSVPEEQEESARLQVGWIVSIRVGGVRVTMRCVEITPVRPPKMKSVGSAKQKLLTMPGSATAQWLLTGNGKEGAIVDQHMP